jgi:hypothetical protein
MKINYFDIILLACLPLLVRIILYLIAFRIRSIHITLINCIVVAGAGYLLVFIPIPLPAIIRESAATGLSMYLMTRYTEAEVFPDGLAIPIAVELTSTLALDQILLPLVH